MTNQVLTGGLDIEEDIGVGIGVGVVVGADVGVGGASRSWRVEGCGRDRDEIVKTGARLVGLWVSYAPKGVKLGDT